ncbi:MAG TPA: N-acetylmuramoyl-L-alanine amidase, partial [bacterium]|nr:N-acetylmuramoyl-L-alanine amidase [bacterium]
RLSDSRSGWIRERGEDGAQVRWLSEGTIPPHNYFTSCEITGDDQYDRIVFSLREPVAFAVSSEINPTNRLIIDIFNTHFATTWMSHKAGAKFIGPVTGEQIEDDCLRVTVPINSKQIWGYWTERSGNTLTVFVRRPPQIAVAPDSPLKGLKFALEAGHGGSSAGAVGTMGTKEKSINLMAVTELERLLKERGAEVIQVRPGDSEPLFRDRLAWTNEFGAHMYIAVHANAAGSSRGFLKISGTSTYYRDIHCWLPSQLVYDKLLGLGWGEFGVVGNFSYYPLRDTRTPGILIEQAFMSNPYDEARMLEPEYQKAQAEVVVEALEEFFDKVRE